MIDLFKYHLFSAFTAVISAIGRAHYATYTAAIATANKATNNRTHAAAFFEAFYSTNFCSKCSHIYSFVAANRSHLPAYIQAKYAAISTAFPPTDDAAI